MIATRMHHAEQTSTRAKEVIAHTKKVIAHTKEIIAYMHQGCFNLHAYTND